MASPGQTVLILSAETAFRDGVAANLSGLDVAHAADPEAARVFLETAAEARPVLLVHAGLLPEAVALLADVRAAGAPAVPTVLTYDEPSSTGASAREPDPAPDEILPPPASPAVIAQRVRTFARLAEAEHRLARLRCYVPTPLYEAVASTGEARASERLDLAVLFGDIRGFTDAADFAETQKTIDVLNDYFRAAATIVSEHHGIIDKFTGDGVIAYFGADGSPDAELDAVEAALELQARLEALRVTWFERGVLPVGLGIGVATGTVIRGTIGGDQRADYTVIGSVVNLAARLQGLAKGGEIALSSRTAARVHHRIKLDEPQAVQIKGFDEPVTLYKVLGRL